MEKGDLLTKFYDNILDIMHVCSISRDFDQAERDFNDLESIATSPECLKEIKEAESLFYIIKEKLTNAKNDYIDSLKNLKYKLSNACSLFHV